MSRLSAFGLIKAGSSGHTLSLIEKELRSQLDVLDMTVVDVEPTNLRRSGFSSYPGNAQVIEVTLERVGLKRLSKSQSVNLILNGGTRAWSRVRDTARRLLKEHNAQVFITCDDRGYIETAFVSAAKQLGIATVLVQEGPMCIIRYDQSDSLLWKAKLALAPIARAAGVLPIMPDYGCAGHDRILAASEKYRTQWEYAGVLPETVRVVGVPRFDETYELRKRSPPRPNARRILYVGQAFAHHVKFDFTDMSRIFKLMATALNDINHTSEIELVLRAHPRSKDEDTRGLLEQLECPVRFSSPGTTIEQDIINADCVIGHYSTAILEAALLRRPLVIIPLARRTFVEDAEFQKQRWLAEVGLPTGEDSAHLKLELAAALDGSVGPADSALLQAETGLVDGRATRRAVDEILSVTHEKARLRGERPQGH